MGVLCQLEILQDCLPPSVRCTLEETTGIFGRDVRASLKEPIETTLAVYCRSRCSHTNTSS